MGVKLRRKNGQWYVFVDYCGRRKAKCIGSSLDAAKKVKVVIEAKLALGDLGFFAERDSAPTFATYAETWLKVHGEVDCKQSTHRSYEQLLRLHVTPVFGALR